MIKYVWYLVLMVGLLLRIGFLFQHDFWFDEAFSYFVAKQDIGKLVGAAMADNHPPFYFLLLHFWVTVFGNSEIVLRLLSLLIGLSIICVLLLSFRLLDKGMNRVGTAWMTLTCLSPLLVYYSVEVRMYGLLVLISFTGVILWVKFLKEGRSVILGLWGLVFLLSVWTHYSAALLYPALALSLVLYPARVKIGLIGLLVTFLGVVPLVNIYLSQPHPGFIAVSDWVGLPATLASFAIGGTGVVTLREYFGNDVEWWVKLLFGGVAMGMVGLFVRGVREVEGRLWLVMFLTPLLLVVATNLFWPVLSVRAMIILAPYYYLICAYGLASLGRKRLAMSVMVIGLLAVNMVVLTQFKGPKIKEATKLVDANLVTLHMSILTYYPFQFYQNDHLNLLVTTNPLSPKTVEIIGGKMSSEMLPESFNLIQIENGADVGDESSALAKIVQHYRLIEQSKLGRITVSREVSM